MQQLVYAIQILSGEIATTESSGEFLLTSIGLQSSARVEREIARLEQETIRRRVALEFFELLSRVLDAPVVLVIEDFHLASPELQETVRRTLQRISLESTPLRFVVTSRVTPAECPAFCDADGVEHAELRLLRDEESRLSLASHRLNAEQVESLVAESGGVPGRLRSFLNHALSSDQAAESLPVDRVRSLIPSLESTERDLLLALAVVQRPFGEESLRALLKGSVSEFRSARIHLTQLGWIVPVREGLTLATLVSPEEILDVFSHERVRSMHQTLANYLRAENGACAQIARHYFESGDRDGAIPFAEEAIRDLNATGRVEEALDMIRRLLEQSVASNVRCSYSELRGDLLQKSGQFAAALPAFESALHLAEPGVDQLRITRKLGGCQQRLGNADAARSHFEDALARLESEVSLGEHLHLMNELATLHLFRMELAQATTFAHRGIELLRNREASQLSSDDVALHSLNLYALSGQTHLRRLEYQQACEEFRRSLEFAIRAGDLASEALILNNLGVACHQSNQLDEALRVFGLAREIAHRLGDDNAYFSVLCNEATICARRGEIDRAVRVLESASAMPQSRSPRARLFFLHSKGLVDRIHLDDAQETWDECSELADRLGDGLFARYSRLYRFENDVTHGRWAAARSQLEVLRNHDGEDARYSRSCSIREAWFESLCGHSNRARACLRRLRPLSPPSRGKVCDYGELWDAVSLGSTLMELEDYRSARAWIEWCQLEFEESKQFPGALECALLLADLSLRAGSENDCDRHLSESRVFVSKHDTLRASRGCSFRAPFLEARLALQRGGPRTHLKDRLVDAAGQLTHGSNQEIGWQLELVARAGGAGSAGRVSRAKAAFLKNLDDADQTSYEKLDHERSLGLTGVAGPRDERTDRAGWMLRVLTQLGSVREPHRVLESMVNASGAKYLCVRSSDSSEPLVECGETDERSKGSGRQVLPLRSQANDGAKIDLEVLFAENAASDEAWDFISLAIPILRDSLTTILESESPVSSTMLQLEDDTLTLGEGASFVSQSPCVLEILKTLDRLRDSHLPVLITGESGTGKDLLVRRIHAKSLRSDAVLYCLDGSAVPDGLFESELLGHEKGAFTGAEQSRPGCLRSAAGGTLYFDNVDSISLSNQAKLVRVLSEESTRPVGGGESYRVDVRVIASSQRDLKTLVDRGDFRSDLYFRLTGICIDLPPLRDRLEDLPVLLVHFLRDTPGGALVFSESALTTLRSHPWPGNARELESLVRRMSLTCKGSVEDSDVRAALGLTERQRFPRWLFENRRYEDLLAEVKREYLLYLFDLFAAR
ncbi:MAG: sigma 54-interacting transcriptional regulator, partial [Planctomycetota bacterium]